MRRRTVLAGALPMGLVARGAGAQAPSVEIQFWHGLPPPLGGMLERIVEEFNAGQRRFRIEPSFRGSYPETMVAATAAFRAGTAPHVVQMFEAGTATMMAAGRAVKPLYEILAETGVRIDFGDYLPPVRSYYSLPDGRMMSLPFNSSTAVLFLNKDHFRRAGLAPEQPPTTWQEVEAAARRMKAAGIACPVSTSWPTWTQVEQFSAIHDIPIATLGNGFMGLGAELRIANPVLQRHLDNLVQWQREGLFRYGGRDDSADALFPAGECGMLFASSGLRARISREARFPWGEAMLPYYADVPGAPKNSIIGGASFWAMNRGRRGSRPREDWQGVAEFFRFLSQTEIAARWHTETGYLPVLMSAFGRLRDAGYYRRNPGADVPIQQLLRGGDHMTENTRGIRLGGFAQIRTIIQEEMERAFAGEQTARAALDNATARGNAVLRSFERQSNAG